MEEAEETISALPESVSPDDTEAEGQIDGAVVGTENYTAASGSTVITLKPDYLNTLTAGEHIIIVLYMVGDAQGTFSIAEKTAEPPDTIEPTDEDSVSPETGDDFHIAAWIILMLISGGAVLTLFAKHRSKKGMSQ